MKILFVFIICILQCCITYSQWEQLGCEFFGEQEKDLAGFNVCMSDNGSIIAFNAPYNSGNGNKAGHVRIYEQKNMAWIKKGLDIDGESALDETGASISLNFDGSIVAIGSTRNQGNGKDAGHVRIYQFIDEKWVQMGDDIDGLAADNLCGRAVSLSDDGKIIAIGAPSYKHNGISSGHVRVFRYVEGFWMQIGEDIIGSKSSSMGISVSLDAEGKILAIGAPYGKEKENNSGVVKIYKYEDKWIQLGSSVYGESERDSFGESISLSSDGLVLAVGSSKNESKGQYTGNIRIFKYLERKWEQIGQNINGDHKFCFFGQELCLNSDGTVLVVGVTNHNNIADDAGLVRVYKYINKKWSKLGGDFYGESKDDYLGSGVSISSDGNLILFGAYGSDKYGLNSGLIKIFKYKQ